MKKVMMGIMLGLLSISFVKAREVPVTELNGIITNIDSKLNNLNNGSKLIDLTKAIGRLETILQNSTISDADKHVEIASFLNQLTPLLEVIIGSGKTDVLAHQETGVLNELNSLFLKLEKPSITNTIKQLQDGIAKLENISSYLTRIKPQTINIQ